jgi:hypothetical protein
MIHLILTIALNYSANATGPCQLKLQQKKWPMECFVSLNIENYKENSDPYNRLNLWCSLFEDELVLKKAPAALFSLRVPSKCLKIAHKSLKNHESIELLEGRFLNSFL